MKKILAVDDKKSSLKVLAAILSDEGYEVIQAVSGDKALDIYKSGTKIDAILSDFKMPKMNGLELFRKMEAIRKTPPFIMMSAYGTVKSAVQALKEGVTNYLIKPLDYDELCIVLKKAIKEHEGASELANLRQQVRDEKSFHGIIGCSRAMTDIYDLVRTVGKTDASVVIYGETGTGKELLARAVHLESSRHNAEMVCINSAALSENLLEAELFGYVKGAFTGAESSRKGRLELANHSTLFLDEIGHMSLRLQAKLLRFLQEKTFEPVGSTLSRKVDVRIIAATNLELKEEIKKERFLSDLLYRIEVIKINVPPLRERKEDIHLLVHYYANKYARQYEKKINGFDAKAMKALQEYHWPGNVRELKNYIERGVILSKKPILSLEALPENIQTTKNSPGEVRSLKDLEKAQILKTLEKYNGNKSLTARHLGISRKTLYKKLSDFK